MASCGRPGETLVGRFSWFWRAPNGFAAFPASVLGLPPLPPPFPLTVPALDGAQSPEGRMQDRLPPRQCSFRWQDGRKRTDRKIVLRHHSDLPIAGGNHAAIAAQQTINQGNHPLIGQQMRGAGEQISHLGFASRVSLAEDESRCPAPADACFAMGHQWRCLIPGRCKFNQRPNMIEIRQHSWPFLCAIESQDQSDGRRQKRRGHGTRTDPGKNVSRQPTVDRLCRSGARTMNFSNFQEQFRSAHDLFIFIIDIVHHAFLIFF